jgi:hypothetical protein
MVVLHSALVDALDPLELKSVIAHEMGHIRFGHTRLSVLLGGLDLDREGMGFPLSLLAGARRVIFLWWQRCQELTADRAGVVATGRPSKTIAALVKLNVGPNMLSHVSIDALAQQAADLRVGWWRIWGFLSQLSATHPFLVNRIQAIVDFVGAPAAGLGAASSAPTPAATHSPPGEAAQPAPADVANYRGQERVGSSTPRAHPPAAAPDVLVAAPSIAEPPAPQPSLHPAPPPPPPRPAVLVAHHDDGSRRVYELGPGETTIGRGSGNRIMLNDGRLSRQHCRLYWRDGAYLLEDLHSSNGTYVNGERITIARLFDGDRLTLGGTHLEFRLGPATLSGG